MRNSGTIVALHRSVLLQLLKVCVCVALVSSVGSPPAAFAETLDAIDVVASGDYLAPKFSPDGDAILVTGFKYRGLSLIDAKTGRTNALVADERAGLSARFLDNHRVLFSAMRAGAVRELVVATASNRVRIASSAENGQPVAVAHGDRVYITNSAGKVRPAATGDRFFAPQPAPTGDWVVFVGLATGVYLTNRDTEEVIHIGRGTSPSWSATGDRIIFERTEDDGHQIVSSDLYIFDIATRDLRRVTTTPELLERRPSFSPDGAHVVFDDNRGAIYRGTLTGAN